MSKVSVVKLVGVLGVAGVMLAGLFFLLASPSWVQASDAPDLSVYKVLNSGAPMAGSQIQYRIAFYNLGTAPAQNVLLTDTLPDGTVFVSWYGSTGDPSVNLTETVIPAVTGHQVVWALDSMPAGQHGNLYATLQITDTAEVGDVLTNVVNIGADDVESNYANNVFARAVTITAPTQDMSIYKYVAGTPLAGNEIQYVLYYNNLGNSTAHNVQITDTLPDGLTYLGLSAPNLTTVFTGSTVVVSRAEVAAGASGSFYVTARIADAAQTGQMFTNTVQVSTSDPDINLANNTYTRTLTVAAPTQDMSIYKFVNGIPLPGNEIQYVIRYYNLGNSPAHGIRITDTLPTDVTYLGLSTSGLTTVMTGSTVVLTQAEIAAGAGGSVYLLVRIADAAQPGRQLTNIVQISTSDVDVNLANNIYAHTTFIAAPPVTTTLAPSGGSLTVYTDTHGSSTTLEAPSDAVSETIDLRFTPVFSSTEPVSPSLHLAGHSFDLNAYLSDTYLAGFKFAKTVTLTIPYDPAELAGVEEGTLRLYRWVSPDWQLVGVRPGEGQTLDIEHYLLIVHLNGLSEFAEIGVTHKIYLPLVSH